MTAKTINRELASKALRAAADCIDCADAESAIDYALIGVAVALTMAGYPQPKPGCALAYMTEDAEKCIAKGEID